MIHKLHTRENKDEEGTDPSDDTDDFTHVGNIHGNEKSDRDPDHSENDSATTLKSLGDDSSAIPLEAHHQVQDDWSDPCMDTKSIPEPPTAANQLWCVLPPQKKNNWIYGDDRNAKK